MSPDRNAPELVFVGQIAKDPEWHMAPHFHPFHELIVIMGGKMKLKVGNKEILGRSGEMFFYEAGLVHEEISDPKDPVQTRFLSFRSRKTKPNFPLSMRDTDGRVGQMISWLLTDWQVGGACGHHLQAILGELARLRSKPMDPLVAATRSHIWSHFREPLTLDHLAKQAQMSRHAFARKFKALAGTTPMREVREARLNEARRLLLSTSLPLKAIAPTVGIGDEYQLSKMFRSHFGIPPREMRSRRAAD